MPLSFPTLEELMPNANPAFVFVHGAWHDAATWHLQNTEGAVMQALVAGLGPQWRFESATCSAAQSRI